MPEPTDCYICGKPPGDMAATISYGPIPLVVLCDGCAKAGLDLMSVVQAGFQRLGARARLAQSADVGHPDQEAK